MAKGKKAIRQIRATELDSIRADVEAVVGSLEAKTLARIVYAAPKLLDEIERLKGQVADRDERLAKIGAATKRPVNKRGPRKPKEAATDPAQTSIVETGAAAVPLE
jgi:hypothetical protein